VEKKHFKVVIAGAGGIGQAAGVLLREIGDFEVDLFIGDRYKTVAQNAARWIQQNSENTGEVESFDMPARDTDENFDKILTQSDIVLDCLPGDQAPRIARLAYKHKIHYANLTEYVKETNEVMNIARDAQTGFILQTGLAPGFVDVLANGLFQLFCKQYKVEKVDSVFMKVGALTQTAYPLHYYGFTWSPVGVATLYVKPAEIIRNYEVTSKASLTERSRIILNGVEYEEDLTSGGAADLPKALAGKTRNLDYKTLRYPGHYSWIDGLLRHIPHGEDRVKKLQEKMELLIPMVEDDVVVTYASVIGHDYQNKFRIMEKFYQIKPLIVAGKALRAIQATTAAGLVESARLLLTGKYKGCILQSQIDPVAFLEGPFVSYVYK
jgi:saccharopine dehydrogenase-like NADP-dependent oxidoreductase